MTTIASAAGRGSLSTYGKRQVALSMYEKGKSFIGAAVLLRRHDGYQYVVLHLYCQGIEITLKALLLLQNFDEYWPVLSKRFGHDLLKLAKHCSRAFGQAAPRAGSQLHQELKSLSDLYRTHRLRYGSGYDLLVSPSTIAHQRVMHRVAAVLRVVERNLNR